MSALDWLLAPLTGADFLAGVWGVADHHTGGRDPDYFEGRLPGLSTVDGLLEHVRPEPSAVRSVKGYEHTDFGVYRLPDGSLDLARVHGDLARGHTIVLDGLERYVRCVTALSHGLEVELNFPVQVNGYLTAPGSAGFLPHYDHHDVLILQLQGSKVWHLYGDAAVPPHDMQRQRENDPHGLPSPTEPPADVHLTAGDTLYLPRGRIHSAETTADASIHLTVGLHVPTVLDLLTHTAHLLSLRDDQIHARLPARYLDDAGVRARLPVLLRDALAAVEQPPAIADGLDAMADLLVRRGRCPPVGQPADVAGIDGQTRVVKYQPLYSRVTSTSGRVALHFAQLRVNAGPEHETALRFLSSSTEPFRVGDLPGLDAARQIELARSLITSGFLVRLPDSNIAGA